MSHPLVDHASLLTGSHVTRVRGRTGVDRVVRTIEGGHRRNVETNASESEGRELRFVELGTLRLGLGVVDRPETISLRRETTSDFLVQFVLEGEVHLAIDGRRHRLGPGNAIVVPPGCRFERRTQRSVGLSVVVDSIALRTRLAERVSAALDRPIEFRTRVVAARNPLLAMAVAIDQALASGLAVVDGPACTAMQRAFIDLLLDLQPHSYADDLVRDDRAVKSMRIETVRALVDRDPSAHLTVEDLASAAECSVRSLQANFAEYGATSPMDFVRRRRLALARTRLLDPTCEDPIGEIAVAHGYRSASRFAADYRRLFGERPSASRGR
jgi:AraC-like DNA-binding protein